MQGPFTQTFVQLSIWFQFTRHRELSMHNSARSRTRFSAYTMMRTAIALQTIINYWTLNTSSSSHPPLAYAYSIQLISYPEHATRLVSVQYKNTAQHCIYVFVEKIVFLKDSQILRYIRECKTHWKRIYRGTMCAVNKNTTFQLITAVRTKYMYICASYIYMYICVVVVYRPRFWYIQLYREYIHFLQP